MLEKCLIEHCSPTLASLKIANLFNYSYETSDELRDSLSVWNRQFRGTGIEIFPLKVSDDNRTLIYVYRRSGLKRYLQNQSVQEFLYKYGYYSFDLESALRQLAGRIANSKEFPHEIGIFLGYPLGDVIGFIENEGKNSKCCGCWKVYCNECEARRTFARYKKCKDVYQRLWGQGRSILQLTVVV